MQSTGQVSMASLITIVESPSWRIALHFPVFWSIRKVFVATWAQYRHPTQTSSSTQMACILSSPPRQGSRPEGDVTLWEGAVNAAEVSKVVSASEGAENAAEVSNIVVGLYHFRIKKLSVSVKNETFKCCRSTSAFNEVMNGLIKQEGQDLFRMFDWFCTV